MVKMSVQQVNFRQISYFVKVAELGSISAAAEKLHVSQPALSARLKELEHRVHTPLFVRHPRGVALTDEGRRFLPYARAILVAVDRASEVLRNEPAEREAIRIGLTPALALFMLPQLLEKSEQASGRRIAVSQAPFDTLLQSLTENKLDAVLSHGPPPKGVGVANSKVVEDLFLVGSAAVVGDGDDPIDLDALPAVPLVLDPPQHFIRQRLEEAIAKKGLTLHIVAEVQPTPAKLRFMKRGHAAAIGPRWLFQDEIAAGEFHARPIINPRLLLTLSLVLNRWVKADVAEQLEALVNETIAELQPGQTSWRLTGAAG